MNIITFIAFGMLSSAWAVEFKDVEQNIAPKYRLGFNENSFCIESLQSFDAKYVGVSSSGFEEYKPKQITIYGKIVHLNKGESWKDISIINSYLSQKMKLLEEDVIRVPHNMDKTTIGGFEYFAKTAAEVELIGYYRTLESGIRLIPDVFIDNKYHSLYVTEFEFRDESVRDEVHRVLGSLKKLGQLP